MIIKRVICAFLCLPLLMAVVSGCRSDGVGQEDSPAAPFSSYRDIPGVTDKDIADVEALKEGADHFVFGVMTNTEAFYDMDGEVRGYSVLLTEWLSKLFGIRFVLTFGTFEGLAAGLRNGEIHFTGNLMPSEERLKIYIMTGPIAQRAIKYLRLSGSEPISSIAERRLPRYALLEGSATARDVLYYANEEFEPVFILDYLDAYDLMKNGEVDALIAPGTAEFVFDEFGDVVTSDYLPMLYSFASMAAQHPKFAPIINTMQKALDNGGNAYLRELYKQGQQEYMKHKLLMRLTDEERAYLKANPVIPFAAEFDNYPICFYNTYVNEWQGISIDVLREVTDITGLEFSIINGEQETWPTILGKLDRGEALIISELIRTHEREGRYLWPDTSLFIDQPALISKTEHHNISLHETLSVNVGVREGTAHAELFSSLFPEHRYTFEFEDSDSMLEAMQSGEIDMVMTNYSMLLYWTNYLELPGYKANIVFDYNYYSAIGFNKDEAVLCSIVDKALELIDTRTISEQWLRRTYDYRIQLAQVRQSWIVGIMPALVLMLFILFIAFMKNIRKSKTIFEQAATLDLANERIDAMIQNIPGMVFQHVYNPPDYTCLFVSEGSKDLTGYEPSEMLVDGAIRFFDIIHPEDTAAVVRLSAETLEQGLPYENTFRIRTRDGEEKWVWERSRVIETHPDGTPHIIEGYQTDVTKQRQHDEAEMANRAKSEFLAKMSHEIRTPMNSIMGFAELASDSETIPQMKGYLNKITDSADWLLHIINDILDISKIEAGKMDLEHVSFNLYDVFTRCQSVILPPAKEKGLDLRIYAEPIVGKQLVGDPVRLYQVLMNLLSNAVKFTYDGTVKFTALVKKEYEDKAALYFEVADSGIGMSEEQVERIFDPFMQADSSTTRNFGGTGLGLTIVKNIVELMGGELRVESSPGNGSKFSFEVFFDTIIAVGEQQERENLAYTEKPYFDGIVLICDDNPLNQEVICEHLSRVGIRTKAAENGKIGVNMVRERMEKGDAPFDLIFMDMFMPVMDGIEAATKIIALDTGTPIIAMTANIMASEIEKYKKYGMPDCLGKPFTAQELWRVLLKYLTPVSVGPIDEYITSNEEMQRTLQTNFVRNYQTIHAEIAEAVAAGDIKLAHRLAHTLKGNAGMLGKTGLKNAAYEVEILLKNEIDSILDGKMKLLNKELALVLEELKTLLDGSAETLELPESMSAEKVLELFKVLEVMLENLNPKSLNLLDSLRAVPGTEELARQIEDFEFESAAATLAELKKKRE